VVAKWVLPEADSAHAHRLLTDVVMAGNRLLVLDLAVVEVTHAIWKQVHRKLFTRAEAEKLLDLLLRCPVTVEPAKPLAR
jgi:predicted nucleic acid-binding protein